MKCNLLYPLYFDKSRTADLGDGSSILGCWPFLTLSPVCSGTQKTPQSSRQQGVAAVHQERDGQLQWPQGSWPRGHHLPRHALLPVVFCGAAATDRRRRPAGPCGSSLRHAVPEGAARWVANNSQYLCLSLAIISCLNLVQGDRRLTSITNPCLKR